jgi:triosephosphate isomerase
MHGTLGEAAALASAVVTATAEAGGAEVVLCPPFTALSSVAQAVDGAQVSLGAQDLHWETQGAYTGEVSAAMLLDLGCRFVIVGHSERRAFFGETDVSVNRKTGAAIAAGLCPIVCVGETLEQRDRGETDKIVRAQVERGLEGLGHALSEIVVAYEPVWAIGTGRTATAEQAQSVHALIRETLAALGGAAAADTVRIQYGGSVKPGNAAELFSGPDVDGGLIGGASLDADSFAQIVRAAG